MALKLYNTLTRSKEEFRPIARGEVGIYVCGVTAYDSCHMGHARSAIVFDVIIKYLRYRGYHVTYIKNFTDIDDKIINRARKEGVVFSEIADRYIREHNEDMDRLGVARPTVAPRATENIQGMIRLISLLIEKGCAYVIEGNVYFAVEAFGEYGKLSGRKLEDMIAGTRIEVDDKKRNPLDFALWKSSKEGEPWWESPWGPGRPGWHIECSVMSQRFLGETFDIHGGGEDLVFPHHENEIAQSESATGKPFANYWIYNGYVRINKEKMSKSLGNIFSIREALDCYHPEVLRLFFLQTHYRSPIDYSEEALNEARLGIGRFYTTLKSMKDVLASDIDFSHLCLRNLTGKDDEVLSRTQALRDKCIEAMDDDFNTARALGYLFDFVRFINAYLSDKKFAVTSEALLAVDTAYQNIREIGKFFGLFLETPEAYFEKDKERELKKLGLAKEDIERLIGERKAARLSKDWKKADEIRNLLAARKVILKDSGGETSWSIE